MPGRDGVASGDGAAMNGNSFKLLLALLQLPIMLVVPMKLAVLTSGKSMSINDERMIRSLLLSPKSKSSSMEGQ